MNKLNVTELQKFLKGQGLDEATLACLTDQLVDGETLSMTTDAELSSLGIKFGPLKKVRRIIQSQKQQEAQEPHSEIVYVQQSDVGGVVSWIPEKESQSNVTEQMPSLLIPISPSSSIATTEPTNSPEAINESPKVDSPGWLQRQNAFCLTPRKSPRLAAKSTGQTDSPKKSASAVGTKRKLEYLCEEEESSHVQASTTRKRRRISQHVFSHLSDLAKEESWDVTEIVQRTEEGRHVLDAGAEKGVLTDKQRRALVSHCVAELVSRAKSEFPPDDFKVALAKAVVRDCPYLKSRLSRHGHEAYFDAASRGGFIEWRLKTIRKNSLKYGAKPELSVPSKPLSCPEPKLLTDEQLEIKIQYMKNKLPTEDNKASIKECLDVTRGNRRQWISENMPTASEIFERYPRLRSYQGQMIDREFAALFPNNDHFLGEFPSFVCPRVLKIATLEKPGLLNNFEHVKDENLKALLILPYLIGVPNYSRSFKKGTKGKMEVGVDPETLFAKQAPHENLFVDMNSGDSVTRVIRQRRKAADGPLQPYVLRAKHDDVAYFYIVVDSDFIEAGTESVTSADLLFKLHFALNLQYSSSLDHFFKYLETIYRIPTTASPKGRSLVNSFYTKIQNISM